MKRDWINEGRRPAGLCGASILVAARFHGFNRTINQIISVVNVCDETIKIRLREFAKTDIANLTKEEFESFNIDFYRKDEFNSKHPPSYEKNRIKDKLDNLGFKNPYSSQYKEKAKEIQKIMDSNTSNTLINGKSTKRVRLGKKSKFGKVHIVQDEKSFAELNTESKFFTKKIISLLIVVSNL